MQHKSHKSPLVVDSIYQTESIDSPVHTYYRGKPFHRTRDVAVFDLEKMVKDHPQELVRSSQEYMLSASGLKRTLFWTVVVFDMGEGVFWHATVKTNSYNTGGAFEGTYTMVVVAPSPDLAVSEMEKIVDKYSGVSTSDRPTFQILREARGQPIQVDVDEKYLLSPDNLDMHYGDGFQEWSETFASTLHESGLSVLQGSPGTGKTSYLRHLICSLWETHRFYYIPVESFHLLSSSTLPAIWNKEERNYPRAIKVIILEDAERLLLEREKFSGSETSSILNLTDGFIGDLVQVHLICTVNSDLDSVDSALLRPGRQKFFQRFDRLSFDQAKKLAEKLGAELDEDRTYSLAEIYHHADIKRAGKGHLRKNMNQIGFNQIDQ